MATLVLAAGAASLATALGWTAAAAAGSILASIGVAALGLGAALLGGLIDSWLFAPATQTVNQEGPRLQEMRIQGSTEGSPIPEVFGKFRLAGQMIWATTFKEVVTTETQSSGGGGKGGGGGGVDVTTTSYTYFDNFAFGVVRAVTAWHRIWADGKLVYRPAGEFSVESSNITGAQVTSSGGGLAYRIPDTNLGDLPSLTVGATIDVDGFFDATNNGTGTVTGITDGSGDDEGYTFIFVSHPLVAAGATNITMDVTSPTGDGAINQLGTIRFYNGTNTQDPDSLIESFQGTGNVPGFRGCAYAVFENTALANFGNRIPNLVFEVENEYTVA